MERGLLKCLKDNAWWISLLIGFISLTSIAFPVGTKLVIKSILLWPFQTTSLDIIILIFVIFLIMKK